MSSIQGSWPFTQFWILRRTNCGPSRWSWLSHALSTTTAPPRWGHFSRRLTQPPQSRGRPTAVPRFRVILSSFGLRLPLYTRTMRSASAMNLRGLYPCSQRHSVTKNTFPQILHPGTVHLNPSLLVSRLVRFRMRQTRISLVAIAKLRLAVSGQHRVCPYPRVSRASDCLYLIVHSLSGQPHPRGGVEGCLPLEFHLLSGNIHHCITQLSWRTFVKRKSQHFLNENDVTFQVSSVLL